MAKINSISAKGLQLIADSEGFEERAYPDPGSGGKPYTIGYGTTRYPDGKWVKSGDVCTKEQALAWLQHDVAGACKDVDDLTTDAITQPQFDALVSFVYNLGRGNYAGSTLRMKINANPSDITIAQEFPKWNKAAGRVMSGLTKRRGREAAMYFS